MNGRLARVLAHKLFALAVLVGVGAWFLVVPAFRPDGLGANPVERLLHRSGEIAVWTLGAVLILTPLRTLFPRSAVVAALNRHRRYIGVSAWVYGTLHLACHVVYQGDWDDLRRSLGTPFVWFGLGGLAILTVLALTSNQWSMRRLGGKNWKGLHRLVYVAAALLIYHQAIAGKGHWYIARWLFWPVVILEAARLVKTSLLRKPQAMRA